MGQQSRRAAELPLCVGLTGCGRRPDTGNMSLLSHRFLSTGEDGNNLPTPHARGGAHHGLGKAYLGPCRDIDQLIVNWDGYFPNLVQFATEDNHDSAPVLDSAQAATNLSAAYLMDMRTWLWYNLGADSQWGYKNDGVWGARGYPFNLIWFNGLDDAGAGGVPGRPTSRRPRRPWRRSSRSSPTARARRSSTTSVRR